MASVRQSWVLCVVCKANRAVKTKGSVCVACRKSGKGVK